MECVHANGIIHRDLKPGISLIIYFECFIFRFPAYRVIGLNGDLFLCIDKWLECHHKSDITVVVFFLLAVKCVLEVKEQQKAVEERIISIAETHMNVYRSSKDVGVSMEKAMAIADCWSLRAAREMRLASAPSVDDRLPFCRRFNRKSMHDIIKKHKATQKPTLKHDFSVKIVVEPINDAPFIDVPKFITLENEYEDGGFLIFDRQREKFSFFVGDPNSVHFLVIVIESIIFSSLALILMFFTCKCVIVLLGEKKKQQVQSQDHQLAKLKTPMNKE
nr:protein gamete expressed 2 isoform X1 [Tanacetum cinerariifolium]